MKMIKMKRRSWTFSFVSGKGIRQFVLKDTYLYCLLGFAVFLFLTTSLLTLRGIKTRNLYTEYKEREAIREEHITSLRERGKEINLLNERLGRYSAFDNKLRNVVDFAALERKLRIMGIGGPSSIDTLKNDLSKSSFRIVSKLVQDFNFADKLIDLEQVSYEEVLKKLKAAVDLKRHTPSIWPTRGYISSGFGYRRHPLRKSVEFHSGLDIANATGTKIYATADGVVDFTGRLGGYGKYLSIDHGYGFKTKYGHLHRIIVEKGQSVRRGELIATMGRTGYATGTHLQYEVRIFNNPVNPIDYIIRDILAY
ncbi:MAG: M23 family metallopeptidase [Candidatus Cloacimonadota bacterium]|nr:MAG: M23 family metallopeptidase [Candidatus Cloacimonadota bacterium]